MTGRLIMRSNLSDRYKSVGLILIDKRINLACQTESEYRLKQSKKHKNTTHNKANCLKIQQV